MQEIEARGSDKFIASKTLRKYPQHFPGTEKAYLANSSRWLKQREEIMSIQDDEVMRVSHLVKLKRLANGSPSVLRKEILVEAGKGRGRKRSVWATEVHMILVVEFERLSKTGLKFNANILKTLARRILLDDHNAFGLSLTLCRNDRMDLSCEITKRWVQSFMERFNIVARRQCGKLMISPVKQEQMEREVAFHLGVVSRAFSNEELDEDKVEDVDETNFVINMDNGRNLSFVGCGEVKYADVSSGGEGMTMMVRITGGKNALIQPPFIVFQNKSRNYPIRRVPDDVPGVPYRTGPKGWMDKRVFGEWLLETRAISKDAFGRQWTIVLDNCSGHLEPDIQRENLAKINAVIKFLSKNATHLCEQADSFVIQKLKQRWRILWDEEKVRLIDSRQWKEGLLKSGKLPNPGKLFFLKLAARVIRDVNKMRDKNGLTYAQKSMIRCGLSRDLNGKWRICPLFPHLQVIIEKQRTVFDGKSPFEDRDSRSSDSSEA